MDALSLLAVSTLLLCQWFRKLANEKERAQLSVLAMAFSIMAAF